jgi:hypothetical protein
VESPSRPTVKVPEEETVRGFVMEPINPEVLLTVTLELKVVGAVNVLDPVKVVEDAAVTPPEDPPPFSISPAHDGAARSNSPNASFLTGAP